MKNVDKENQLEFFLCHNYRFEFNSTWRESIEHALNNCEGDQRRELLKQYYESALRNDSHFITSVSSKNQEPESSFVLIIDNGDSINIDQSSESIPILREAKTAADSQPAPRMVSIDELYNSKQASPVFEFLLTKLIPAKHRDSVIGDLDEEFSLRYRKSGAFKAQSWYCCQAISTVRLYLAALIRKAKARLS